MSANATFYHNNLQVGKGTVCGWVTLYGTRCYTQTTIPSSSLLMLATKLSQIPLQLSSHSIQIAFTLISVSFTEGGASMRGTGYQSHNGTNTGAYMSSHNQDPPTYNMAEITTLRFNLHNFLIINLIQK
jgi:hypothetical protein